MLKKLLAVAIVVLMMGAMAVPVSAQESPCGPPNADLMLEWGTQEWFVNQFGCNGDISGICNTVGQDPATKADWISQFPDMPSWCGWSS